MRNRAVSEALGFVLVFALIVGTVGVVYATGISGLHDAREAEKLTNVERAFDVLADNIDDLHRQGAPSRATEIKLAGGSIGTGAAATFEIRAVNSSDPLDNRTYEHTVEPIIYRDADGPAIVYIQGAVIRSASTGAVMLSDPPWIFGQNRSVLPQIATHGSDSIAGSATVLVVTKRKTRSLQSPFEVNGSATAVVNVTVTSDRVAVWKRYFEDQGLTPVDDSLANDNVTYQFETETVYVPKTGIDVSINR